MGSRTVKGSWTPFPPIPTLANLDLSPQVGLFIRGTIGSMAKHDLTISVDDVLSPVAKQAMVDKRLKNLKIQVEIPDPVADEVPKESEPLPDAVTYLLYAAWASFRGLVAPVPVVYIPDYNGFRFDREQVPGPRHIIKIDCRRTVASRESVQGQKNKISDQLFPLISELKQGKQLQTTNQDRIDNLEDARKNRPDDTEYIKQMEIELEGWEEYAPQLQERITATEAKQAELELQLKALNDLDLDFHQTWLFDLETLLPFVPGIVVGYDFVKAREEEVELEL